MIIGVPKEVKDHETRVGITPAGAKALTEAGHKVLVEHNAGQLSSFPDDDYQAVGAEIVGARHRRLAHRRDGRQGQGAHREGVRTTSATASSSSPTSTSPRSPNSPTCSSKKSVTGIAYETVRDRAGTLPLLTPMTEVAGRMSVQVGAAYLEKEHGGRGVLLGGVPGVPPGNVCIIGGGIVGTNAAKMALGLGAKVTLVDLNLNRLRDLDDIFNGRVFTLASNSYNIERAAREADLVIGGVLIPGAAAPKIVTRADGLAA